LINARLTSEATGEAPGRARLEGRTILVAGAGQQTYGDDTAPVGNGRAISVLCGREGAAVMLVDIDEQAVQDSATSVREEGANVATFVGDASNEAVVEQMIAESVREHGDLDGIVMNLGVARGVGLEGTTSSDWDQAFAINVRSHFLGCKHGLAAMQPGGSIVLISSIAALAPVNDIPAYQASKAALTGVCQYAALKGAERGIRVNIVVPGLIDTALGRLASAVDPERAGKSIPLGRQGTAWEVAYATAFLLGHEASYITGQALVVDGGYIGLR
jgi:NAD(P)-dependent dehydrogenase (short-subunit alcohol dehydrogenase family)